MIKVIPLILLFISPQVSAQTGSFYGNVSDEEGNPIIGANITIDNTLLGTATDSKGNYFLQSIPAGEYSITASVIGYNKMTRTASAAANETVRIDFKLASRSYQFDQLIITANKFATDIKEIASSSYVLDQKIFSEKNIKQLDEALRYVPGISMISDQISIRGSSGYGRGAGTRVLIAIDGIPIYTPDSGDIIWELVPISEIERVEVIKGSVSSLYGSSAIGGVINIITKEMSSNPLTYAQLKGGVYSDPSHDDWKWTDKTLSYNSQTIVHSRTIDKLSLAGSITRFEDFSYRKNDYQLRFSGFLKANYHFSESTSLSFMGTGYTRNKNTYNYWKDIQNALTPPDEDIGQNTDSDRSVYGLTFNHIFNDNFSLTFIPSAYVSYWDDDSEDKNRSNSKLYRSEIRTNFRYSKNLKFITGTEQQYSRVGSNIFGNTSSNGIGIYSQADYKPTDRMNFSLGLRYDYSKLENLNATQSFSPKLGITYQLSSRTLLRGLISRGFRAPSLAEAFTSTTSAGITVKPNPDIESETSLSFEVGTNHILTENINFDLSLFDNEYYDMIEPGFDPNDGQVFFNNVTRARIVGAEFTANILVFPSLELDLGYVYMWPRDIEKKRTLNYRSRHTLLAGVNYTQNLYQFGLNFRYMSRFENIDDELVDLGVVTDGDNRVEIFVLDMNAGVNLFRYNIPARLYISAKNLLNYNYVELIGNIAPIRNYSVNMEFIF